MEGVDKLCGALENNESCCSVLEHFVFSTYQGKDSEKSVRLNATASELVLSKSGLGVCGSRLLAAFLHRCSELTSLDVSNNEMAPDSNIVGLGALCVAVQRHQRLQKLTFSGGASSNHQPVTLHNHADTAKFGGKNLGWSGMMLFAAFLPKCQSLTDVDISDCNLGTLGAEHVAAALATNSTVQSVDLSGNAIGDDGLKHLCENLHQNTTIRELKLKNNKIGAAGAEYIARYHWLTHHKMVSCLGM